MPGQRLLCLHAQSDIGGTRQRRRSPRHVMLWRGLCDIQHCLRGGPIGVQCVRLRRVVLAELLADPALRQRGDGRLRNAARAAKSAGVRGLIHNRRSPRTERKPGMNQMIQNPADLLAALDRGESLPAQWYTDPSITEQEIVHVFRKSWNYIGPMNELKNTGDYITGYAGEVPVVVMRNETGLAGFINVCRHRRHEVMKGRGNAKVMQCGYHAWTYDLSGCLKGAPRSAAERNFRLEDYPLLPLRAESLGPFVFVNLDAHAMPLLTYFGDV